jgi:hypothetical protein
MRNETPRPARQPAGERRSRYGRVRLQVPINEKGFPPEKLTEPESLHRGFAAVGAVVSRNRVVTPELWALPHRLPSECR